jgi:hypothetical protein
MNEARAKEMEQMMRMGQMPLPQKIMLQRPGEAPKELSIEEVAQIMQSQQEHIKQLLDTVQQKDAKIAELTAQIQSMSKPQTDIYFTPVSGQPNSIHSIPILSGIKNKSDPEITVQID